MNVRQMNPFAGSPKTDLRPKRTDTPKQNTLNQINILKQIDISSFQKDDWILLGIIGTLILEGSRDYVLLVALGYLFIMGFGK